MGKPSTGQLHAPLAHCRWIGERGLRVATGEQTLARYELLISVGLKDIEDIIPAHDSLLLVFRPTASVSPEVWAALVEPLADLRGETAARLHEIAVDYGGTAGPDLQGLAKRADMSVTAYIERHAAAVYTVAFLGFQPGFPYLRGLPTALRAPRRATPRQRVAAGSVAVGGAYAGIYPTGGPGGWHIIGRTAAVLFDPQREVPALLMPGDRVRFVPT